MATVVGVPLGTVVGQAFGWRSAFAGVVGLGLIALAAVALFVPAVSGAGSSEMAPRPRDAFAPRVLAMLMVGVLALGRRHGPHLAVGRALR